MSFLTNLYNKTIEENENKLCFWEDYLNKLKSLDFAVYSDKLRVPVLVPVGTRILFRGDIIHTNEVTVSLGADYFVKCSIKQAEVLKQHRIKDAQANVDMYRKEKEYLESQISFSKANLFEQVGQEIVEAYTEEEDKVWREKHKENMRKYKQENKQEEKSEDVTDEELWQRLEELELQEELENELQEMNNEDLDSSGSNESFIIKEDVEILTKQTEEKEKDFLTINNQSLPNKSNQIEQKEKAIIKDPPQTSKLDLLQQVIDRQNELENRLLEMKNRERTQTKTENDVLSRLDEIEKLEEIEDEMDRLDDVLESEDMQETEEKSSQPTTVKRHVTFADDDDSETLELTFKHSNVESDKSLYDPVRGIHKPSDIYEAYSVSFGGSTSILKKTKYEIHEDPKINTKQIANNNNNLSSNEGTNKRLKNNSDETEEHGVNETIIIKDVIEKIDQSVNIIDTETRPTSLFKKKRMQKKS